MGISNTCWGQTIRIQMTPSPRFPRVVPAPTSTRVARRRRPRKTCGRSKSSTTRHKTVLTRRSSVNKNGRAARLHSRRPCRGDHGQCTARRDRCCRARRAGRATMSHLIEILLPLTNASGTPFPGAYYDDLAQELVANFGGVTSHAGARGGPLARWRLHRARRHCRHRSDGANV